MKKLIIITVAVLMIACKKEVIEKGPVKKSDTTTITNITKPIENEPIKYVELKDTVYIEIIGFAKTTSIKTVSLENYFYVIMDSTFVSKKLFILKEYNELGVLIYSVPNYPQQCQGFKIEFTYHNNKSFVGKCGHGDFKWRVYISNNIINFVEF